MAALSAGKHVYIQMTIALNVRDAQEVLAEAPSRNLTLVASPEQMLNPAVRAARQMLTEGAIGLVFWALCATDYCGQEGEGHRRVRMQRQSRNWSSIRHWVGKSALQ